MQFRKLVLGYTKILERSAPKKLTKSGNGSVDFFEEFYETKQESLPHSATTPSCIAAYDLASKNNMNLEK